ncbi:MAG: hypothetical protein J6A68_00130 [Oscillospiraceae bacterium]|nr:hypothetical protein [Oscillospiraceae bacterium]
MLITTNRINSRKLTIAVTAVDGMGFSYSVLTSGCFFTGLGTFLGVDFLDFEVELAEEFFAALCRSLGLNLHIRKLAGRNTHHLLEAVFKSFGRAMRQAVKIDPELADEIPSSKGMLE